MATAKTRTEYHTETVMVPQTKTITTKFVDLTLTTEEARVLCQILSRVGGSPDAARGKADSISDALESAGFTFIPSYSSSLPENLRLDGHLIFADEDGLTPRERALF